MTRIDFISIQALCHATESEDKVSEALKRLYPSFEKHKATGHFGNPIYIFATRITRKREAAAVTQLLREKASSALCGDFERRIDEKGNLYIRLDKQELYRGNIVLRDNGEIKITIHIQSYPFSREDAVSYAEELFSH